MSEANMRRTLVKALKPLHAISIESPVTGLGIPDVNFAGGWIECKYMKHWPYGCDTHPVKFSHTLSQEQKIWQYKRAKAGGLGLVAAQVSRSWFFFDGLEMMRLWDAMSRPHMEEKALLYMEHGLDKDKLIIFLVQQSFISARQRLSSLNAGGIISPKK